MMICLTIITIISMLISFFSLKISAENTRKTSQEWERMCESLRKDIEKKTDFIRLLDNLIEKLNK